MQYLWDILNEDGAQEIHLGNLYIGGCTLETHAGHFQANNAAYTYYTNSTGEWTSQASYKPLDALQEREWDYITMQQSSGVSGIESSYDPYLETLVGIVKEHCPKSKLLWHMTWAYQGDSNHSSFPKYGSNQMTMYNAILDVVSNNILPIKDFVKVIPSGTAVQNLRTSVYGDTVTRDGYHMSYDAGRFVTALTWAGAIYGTNPLEIEWHPAYTYSDARLAAIRECAANAVEKPFEITQSHYTWEPEESAAFEDLLTYYGYNPQNYERKAFTVTHFAYYNSTNATMLSTMYTHQTSTASNLDDFCATPIFDKADIPYGSLIVVLPGYQYRPEGWVDLKTKNNSADRPAQVTTNVVEVNAAWWGSWNYRAFNLLKNPRTTLNEETAADVAASFAIFTPAE